MELKNHVGFAHINYDKMSNYHSNKYRPPAAKPSEVMEFYKIILESMPSVDPLDIQAMATAATRYAKQIVKGKTAELFGLSLDTAIKWLRDDDVPMNYKRDIIVKVLGHSLPQNIQLNTIDENEESRPVIFQMTRPAVMEEVKQVEEVTEAETVVEVIHKN